MSRFWTGSMVSTSCPMVAALLREAKPLVDNELQCDPNPGSERTGSGNGKRRPACWCWQRRNAEEEELVERNAGRRRWWSEACVAATATATAIAKDGTHVPSLGFVSDPPVLLFFWLTYKLRFFRWISHSGVTKFSHSHAFTTLANGWCLFFIHPSWPT